MNERLKELAEQAGIEYSSQWKYWTAYENEFEIFAELVRQDEREVCAKLCEDLNITEIAYPDWDDGTYDCAKAIRARGEK